MAKYVNVYCVIHQPRRLKLPAQIIPRHATPEDIARCLFDEPMNRHYLEKVARTCYRPATKLFRGMLDRGFKLSLGLSMSFVEQAEKWAPDVIDDLKDLLAHENCELVAVEPYHSFLFYFDMQSFTNRMRDVAHDLSERLNYRSKPTVADTTEMFMSNDIYHALHQAGYEGALIDGRPWVMGWRSPAHIYHYGKRPLLLVRHTELSDDVGYRFSNRNWNGWPLTADRYADWLNSADGDCVTIGWDYETFGEHHWQDSGIFQFMDSLIDETERRDISFVTASEAIRMFRGESHHLPLPEHACTWAGSGDVGFFLGNEVQQAIFRLMHHAYNKAILTGDPKMIDLAMWLTQSDNLHLIQWYGRSGAEAEVSAYFTPREWWQLGAGGIATEMQNVYKNFIAALDYYVPGFEEMELKQQFAYGQSAVLRA